VLTAIYEQDFVENSYGYRPNRSAKTAISELTFNLQFGKFGHIVEADIKGFSTTWATTGCWTCLRYG
jgi:RNA-directed DNA polymerase